MRRPIRRLCMLAFIFLLIPGISPAYSVLTGTLQADIVRFHASGSSDPAPKKDMKRWERTQKEVDQLKLATVENEVVPDDQIADDSAGE